jgi:hypothetical protein
MSETSEAKTQDYVTLEDERQEYEEQKKGERNFVFSIDFYVAMFSIHSNFIFRSIFFNYAINIS